MIRTAGRILKSNNVKLEGQFQLDAANAGLDLPKQKIALSSAPNVRILENHPEYAVIEVTCSCGTRMSLKCEYAGAAAKAPDDPQT
ncbi:MAG: hypothetical protein A2168_02230 [Planctomycetes bacterium RBG_13_50_24]|nr:MAG: hypothetical protein A2168_02230 [Planctomycetes bacterium RBG_13_50_24]